MDQAGFAAPRKRSKVGKNSGKETPTQSASRIVVSPSAPKVNGGSALPVSITGLPDSELIEFVRSIGTARVLEAACAVEASQ